MKEIFKEKVQIKLLAGKKSDLIKYRLTKEELLGYFYEEAESKKMIGDEKFDLVIIEDENEEMISFDRNTNTYTFNITEAENILSEDEVAGLYSLNNSNYNLYMINVINKIISEIELRRSLNKIVNVLDPETYVRLTDELVQEILDPNFEKKIFNRYSNFEAFDKTYKLIKECWDNTMDIILFAQKMNCFCLAAINDDEYSSYQDKKYIKRIADYDKLLLKFAFSDEVYKKYKRAKKDIGYEPFVTEELIDRYGDIMFDVKTTYLEPLRTKIALGKEIHKIDLQGIHDKTFSSCVYIPDYLDTCYGMLIEKSLTRR